MSNLDYSLEYFKLALEIKDVKYEKFKIEIPISPWSETDILNFYSEKSQLLPPPPPTPSTPKLKDIPVIEI